MALATASLGLFFRQFGDLWELWSTNSLQSIGILAIPVSALLMVRTLDWRDLTSGGSWLGLAPLALALALANLQLYGPASLGWDGAVALSLVANGPILYLYASGAILILGGARAWHKAAFPLLLLIFVKPVPGFFTHLVDLPLQHLGAEVARGFARLLHVPVEGTALDVMFFHNELGMFVAPACNGLQGAAAMGLAALVVGHLRRVRTMPYLLFIAGAVALAYVFNLLRLSALVLYYCLAHLLPILGIWGVAADYVIGGALFLSAALFLFKMPLPIRAAPPPTVPEPAATVSDLSVKARLAALAALMGAFAVFAYCSPGSALTAYSDNLRARLLPARIGEFSRKAVWFGKTRSHSEIGATYLGSDGVEIGLAIWLENSWRPQNAIACWFVRGEVMPRQQIQVVRTATAMATFDTAFFADRQPPVLLANTECYPTGCREQPLRVREGFALELPSISIPGPVPVSVLVRETGQAQSESSQMRAARLSAAFQRFATALDLSPLLTSDQVELATQSTAGQTER
ncbi:MAG: exosortase J [Candidatus Binataceae bacterium]